MRILFVGGGTLGSVTPLLAVAEELQKKTPGVFFWGTRTGPERTIVEAANIPFRSIPTGKLRRYWDLRNLLDLVVVKWAFWIALIRLIHWRPSVVVGAGSFVQVPVMWAAWVLRIPIVIHQLDVRPSLANRLVAPLATRITVTFSESARSYRNATVIGAPVRAAVLAARDFSPRDAKRHFGFSGDRPVLLVIGGGTGAQFLNELVWGALPELTAVADVIHLTGRGKSRTPTPSSQSPTPPYRSFDFLTDDFPHAYAAADLVVARAGMGTITELTALQKPMVLVPMPGTHQEDNAAAMTDAGTAVVWSERELTAATFADRVRAILADTHRQATITRACGVFVAPGAADRLAAVVRAAARPLPM